MSRPAVDVDAVLAVEIDVLSDRLASYRRKADKRAARKGDRDDHADRLCEWAEIRLENLRAARETVRAMTRPLLSFPSLPPGFVFGGAVPCDVCGAGPADNCDTSVHFAAGQA